VVLVMTKLLALKYGSTQFSSMISRGSISARLIISEAGSALHSVCATVCRSSLGAANAPAVGHAHDRVPDAISPTK
jgi:hypothetical protein